MNEPQQIVKMKKRFINLGGTIIVNIAIKYEK